MNLYKAAGCEVKGEKLRAFETITSVTKGFVMAFCNNQL